MSHVRFGFLDPSRLNLGSVGVLVFRPVLRDPYGLVLRSLIPSLVERILAHRPHLPRFKNGDTEGTDRGDRGSTSSL